MGPCGNGWNDSQESGAADAPIPTDSNQESTSQPSPSPPIATITRDGCGWYTSYYCEENVLRLYKSLADDATAAGVELHVVFVSNVARQVPIWCQVLAEDENQPVLWDYHVLLLARHPDANWIYDLDSSLPFPTPASEYMTQAFHGGESIDERYRQIFRVVPAAECWAHFASDRSHMRSGAGDYSAQPPSQPPLRGEQAASANNMDEWINMDETTGRGRVLKVSGMMNFVRQLPLRYS